MLIWEIESKVRQAQQGESNPFPVPSQPWSHFTLDFVTGLPNSWGNSVILTIIYSFSKVVLFVAVPIFPSVSETDDLQVYQVFQLHGIPKVIVSYRCTQFTL